MARQKNAAAAAMADLRWSRTTKEERREHAQKMAAAKWKGTTKRQRQKMTEPGRKAAMKRHLAS